MSESTRQESQESAVLSKRWLSFGKAFLFSGCVAAFLSLSTSIPTDHHQGGLFEVQAGDLAPLGEATVTIDFEVDGAGSGIDTIAFWEAPDPKQSLMFVTSKDNGLKLVEVWKHPFGSAADELTPLKHSCINQGPNGVEVDQGTDRLYVSIRFSSNVCVFSLPELRHLNTFGSGARYDTEPNLALLKLTNGSKRLYVSDRNIVYIHDAASGAKLGQFAPRQASHSVEDMVGDDFYQIVHIPDERGGTGVYPHSPDGSAYTRNGQDRFGGGGIFDADEEGILIYTCPSDGSSDNGEGLIVVSDQITDRAVGNDYEVFDRRTWEYLGKFKLKDAQGNYIYNTDGIASTQQASSEYPMGLFTAVNNDRTVVGVGWDRILAATGLSCGASGPLPTPTPTVIPSPTATPPTLTPTQTPTFSPNPTATPLPTDLNLDGRVDVLDVQLCVNVFLEVETAPLIVSRADVNLDGAANVLDVQLIVNSFLAN